MITLDLLADLSALAYLVIFALAASDVVVPVLPGRPSCSAASWRPAGPPVPALRAAGGRRRGDRRRPPVTASAGGRSACAGWPRDAGRTGRPAGSTSSRAGRATASSSTAPWC